MWTKEIISNGVGQLNKLPFYRSVRILRHLRTAVSRVYRPTRWHYGTFRGRSREKYLLFTTPKYGCNDSLSMSISPTMQFASCKLHSRSVFMEKKSRRGLQYCCRVTLNSFYAEPPPPVGDWEGGYERCRHIQKPLSEGMRKQPHFVTPPPPPSASWPRPIPSVVNSWIQRGRHVCVYFAYSDYITTVCTICAVSGSGISQQQRRFKHIRQAALLNCTITMYVSSVISLLF